MATIDEIVMKWDEKRPDKIVAYEGRGVKWRCPKENGIEKIERGRKIHIGGFNGTYEFAYIKFIENNKFRQYGANYMFIYPTTENGTIKVRFEINEKQYEYKAGKNSSNTYNFLNDLKEEEFSNKATDIWQLCKVNADPGDILRLEIQLKNGSTTDQVYEKMEYLIDNTREKLLKPWL